MHDVVFNKKHVPTIKEFMKSSAFIRGLMGPFGSGKSSGCVVELMQRALAQRPGPDGVRRTRWAVVRNTYGQLSDTTIKTFHQWFPPHIFGDWRQMDHRYLINTFDGAEIEILFRALDRPDQVSNLLSMELTGAWVNEAREVPWAIIEALQGRVGRYPARRDGGPTWHGIIMDTNPPDIDSKWYKFFEEQQHPKNIAEIFKQPSGRAKEAENLENLPPGYYEKMMVGKDPEWIKVYIDGRYGFVIDGRPVYPEYNDQTHCGPCRPNEMLPIYRGWDFGLTPACAMAQLLPTGQLIVIDELVSENMGVDQFADELISFCSINYPGMTFIDIGDPAGEQRAQTDTKTCFQILNAKGINIEGGLQTIPIRLESVKRPLRTLALKGVPAFRLDPRCKTLRKGFQGGYQFRRLQTSAERYTDAPDKNFYSHIMNGLEYLCTRLYGGGITEDRRRFGEPKGNFDDFLQYERSETTGY